MERDVGWGIRKGEIRGLRVDMIWMGGEQVWEKDVEGVGRRVDEESLKWDRTVFCVRFVQGIGGRDKKTVLGRGEAGVWVRGVGK